MLKTDLLELVNQGEGPKLEFKRDDTRAENLAKEVVAFANMNGGIILLGVEDNGRISGINRPDIHEWLMNTVIDRHVHPFIQPKYREISMDEKQRIAVLDVPMGMAKPYVLRHNNREDIYIRMDTACQHATREQRRRLFESGGLLSVEKLPIHGSSIKELDERRLYQYFCHKLGYSLDEWQASKTELLRTHSFLIEREGDVCSYFACALFGKYPRRWLPQASLRLMVFADTDMDYNANMDEWLNLPLVGLAADSETGYYEPSLVEQAIEHYLKPHLSRDELNVEQSMARQRRWDYPPDVLRELIINAFAHRDWTRQQSIEVVAYADRLEVISPGALPNGMTVEKIKAGARMPRNNQIINILRDYDMIEHRGMGIRRKVIPLTLEHTGREPEFEATEDHFKVTLYKKTNA